MNENLNNVSEEFKKQLLSATIKREVKENMEINVKQKPNDNKNNNDFIIYMELHLENLVIRRYNFVLGTKSIRKRKCV
ncbi:hypothetical protein PFTANZ_05596 [Plasmodium falciparum Tanzania (2000708)]|uniref:Uncharacterized protein n=1 Tax=Plasmodium falciparum Tanzania (2000708) TaxID=1036725 RepID=A0A024VZJ1_PLAFA|nr:hypothetical protein PFTANZ_05596 [Plasmodium falciparum Tanzania (2000708)]